MANQILRLIFKVMVSLNLIFFISYCSGFTSESPSENSISETEQAHIILIMTDQHRGDALGYAGNNAVISPNLDQLAAEGVHFRNGYSSTPSCTPARAALLTGMSPWNHGMLGYGKIAREYKFEMPKLLRELGYFTFGIGKMHWFPQNNLHGFHGTILDESARVEQEGFVSDYRKWFMLEAPGKNPDATGIGFNEHRAGTYQLSDELHPTVWTGKTAVEFISNYDLNRPLFLKISFARPHSPYDPPQKYLDMYKDTDIPEPFLGNWAAKFADHPQSPNAAFGDFGIDHAINSRRHYYALITQIDDQIGKIVEILKQKGMYENSLILFTSDHGDMLGDHHHWRKTYAYEGSAKVPFLLKWPENSQGELGRGATLEHPVELRDVLPTFLDVAGGRIPKEMDGLSLLAIVENPDTEWRSWIDLEHTSTYIDENYWSALTDGKMKYIWFFRTGEEQLFNLQEDPGETINLVGIEEYESELKLWRSRLGEHLSERGEEFAKGGIPIKRKESMVYSSNYPEVIDMKPEEKLNNWRENISWLYDRYRSE